MIGLPEISSKSLTPLYHHFTEALRSSVAPVASATLALADHSLDFLAGQRDFKARFTPPEGILSDREDWVIGHFVRMVSGT